LVSIHTTDEARSQAAINDVIPAFDRLSRAFPDGLGAPAQMFAEHTELPISASGAVFCKIPATVVPWPNTSGPAPSETRSERRL
jgi:hypothetical protein